MAGAAHAQPTDPYVYTEEAEAAKALEFAKTENTRSPPRQALEYVYMSLQLMVRGALTGDASGRLLMGLTNLRRALP